MTPLFFLDDLAAFYEQHPDEARRFLAAAAPGSPPHPAPVQVAGLTLVANQLLNLDEVLNK